MLLEEEASQDLQEEVKSENLGNKLWGLTVLRGHALIWRGDQPMTLILEAFSFVSLWDSTMIARHLVEGQRAESQ